MYGNKSISSLDVGNFGNCQASRVIMVRPCLPSWKVANRKAFVLNTVSLYAAITNRAIWDFLRNYSSKQTWNLSAGTSRQSSHPGWKWLGASFFKAANCDNMRIFGHFAPELSWVKKTHSYKDLILNIMVQQTSWRAIYMCIFVLKTRVVFWLIFK